MTSKPSSRTRPAYEPPQVFRIRVAGDELAVAGCKNPSSSGGPGPATGCRINVATPCSATGS